MLKHFDGMVMRKPGQRVGLRTNEGPAGVKELIAYLKKAKPIKPIIWDDNIAKAAKDHVLDTGPSGHTGHDGVDGSDMSQRIERYTKIEATAGENCDYGETNPRGVILDLAIDDGVPSRGHRENMMNPDFVLFGCHTGYHKTYK